MFSKCYGENIEIIKGGSLVINSSLDSSFFCGKTGFMEDDWSGLIRSMHEF